MLRKPLAIFMAWAVGVVSTSCLGEVIRDEGQAKYIPWSGYWWPFCEGGLLAPLRQYDLLTGKQAAEWEKRHGRTNPAAPRWHGYCHGQAAAAIMEPEPQHPIFVRTPRLRGGLEVSVGHQKGWLVACHTADLADVHGDRFGDEEGSEDPDDLRPDHLWHLLQLYVRQREVPVALDIEPGPEVWNYPVFRYEVIGEGDGENGLYRARLTLWMTDSSVSPDFVGSQIRKHSYLFTFTRREGAVVMGSGQWIGPSRFDHPDFLWYAYAVVPENPEVHYRLVKKLLQSGRTSGPEVNPPDVPPNQPGGTREGPPPDRPPASRPDQLVLSPQEFLALVTARRSSFKFDVTVDRFDGARYAPGDEFEIRGATAEPGYLYLFLLNPRSEITLLYPPAGDQQRVENEFQLPRQNEAARFHAPAAPGLYRLKAIITGKPIRIVGLGESVSTQAEANHGARPGGPDSHAQGQTLNWHPAAKTLMREVLTRYAKGEEMPLGVHVWNPEEVVGRFAQDEVAFYVYEQTTAAQSNTVN